MMTLLSRGRKRGSTRRRHHTLITPPISPSVAACSSLVQKLTVTSFFLGPCFPISLAPQHQCPSPRQCLLWSTCTSSVFGASSSRIHGASARAAVDEHREYLAPGGSGALDKAGQAGSDLRHSQDERGHRIFVMLFECSTLFFLRMFCQFSSR